MAQANSLADEITEFLNSNIQDLEDLPQIINLAFSGERKPEAWHVRIINKQVVRGFNKSAPVTVMLPLKSWRKLMKKNDKKLWREALETGQIHIHGDGEAVAAVEKIFHANGKSNSKIQEEAKAE
ncbi:MAG: hypothetical protein D6814_08775 [Calditrichaeota bacterium]|nr:MAG: hypothetical protein D6814_08775 [Calditrichota bacterium]